MNGESPFCAKPACRRARFLPLNRPRTNSRHTKRAVATGSDANLYRANLTQANLEGATVGGVLPTDLRRAVLNGAYLQGANVTFAKLQDASLLSANLLNANLFGANLQGANLSFSGEFTATQVRRAQHWALAYYPNFLLEELGLPPNHNEVLKNALDTKDAAERQKKLQGIEDEAMKATSKAPSDAPKSGTR